MVIDTWTGAAGDDLWEAPGNWGLGQVPMVGDSVDIGASGPSNVPPPTVALLDGQSADIGSLTDFGTVQLNGATLDAGALTIDYGGYLYDFGSDGTSGRVAVSGSAGIVDNGDILVDDSVLIDSGACTNNYTFDAVASTVDISGELINSSLFKISGAGTTTVASVDDSRGAGLWVGSVTNDRGELDVTSGAASFGTTGELIGDVDLEGGLISFSGGGEITDILGDLFSRRASSEHCRPRGRHQ
jgi:hypothetical protein